MMEPHGRLCLTRKAAEIIGAPEHYVLITGGRTGGKTKASAIISALYAYAYPNTDQLYCRASYGSMADSCFAEYQDALDAMPDGLGMEFAARKSPLRFERGDLNRIYFLGIGGSNLDRSKGFKASHPIKVVVIEETQELPSREHFDQAMASIRRNLAPDAKIIVLGNPPAQKGHWFNRLAEEKRFDRDWKLVSMTWMDIVPFLNDYDIKEILKERKRNREYYEWFYMGKPTSSLGAVYVMYNPERHKWTPEEFGRFRELTGARPVGCVIGGDGAVTHDCTAFVPLVLMSNGQSFVADVFHHDPVKDGVFGSQQLCQYFLQPWFDGLCRRFNLGTREELRNYPYAAQCPILMAIDEASADLRQACKFFFSPRATVVPAKKDKIPAMVGRMQSAIANDLVNVIDFGGYYDYAQKKWLMGAQNPVDYQLQNLIWNDHGTGYDPLLPNDDCDALTYAVNAWYANAENMQWMNIHAQSAKIYDTIRVRKG